MENKAVISVIKSIIWIFSYAIISNAIFVSCVILASPIYLLRFVTSKLSGFGPRLGKILPAIECILNTDDIYGNPKCSVLLCITLKGDNPNLISYCREVILNKVINGVREDGESAQFQADEMKQYTYRWMGFYFWRWDEDFDIANHINFYSSSETDVVSKISQTQLRRIENFILVKPFMRNRSPWDVHVVRNVVSDNGELSSVMFFRYHHVLSDGLSAMKIFFTAFFQNQAKSIEDFIVDQTPIKRSLSSSFTQLLHICKNIIILPRQFQKYVLPSSTDKNDWIPSSTSKTKTISVVSEKLKIDDVKEIAKFHGVGVNAVLFAGLTAALRKEMLRKNGKVPKYILDGAPLFIPGHQNKLGNHFTMAALGLPVGEPDSIRRLQKLQKTFLELKSSFYPIVGFHMMPFIGYLFDFMIKYITDRRSLTAGSSSFPGPKEKKFIDGQEATDVHFLSGTFLGNSAVVFTTLSYCDGLRITLTSRSPMLQNENELQQILKDIQGEFCILKSQLSNKLD